MDLAEARRSGPKVIFSRTFPPSIFLKKEDKRRFDLLFTKRKGAYLVNCSLNLFNKKEMDGWMKHREKVYKRNENLSKESDAVYYY